MTDLTLSPCLSHCQNGGQVNIKCLAVTCMPYCWNTGLMCVFNLPLCFQAYADYIGFILTLNEGVKGKKLTCEYKVSEVRDLLVLP